MGIRTLDNRTAEARLGQKRLGAAFGRTSPQKSVGQARPSSDIPNVTFGKLGQLGQSGVELPNDESYKKQLVNLVGVFGGLGNKLNRAIIGQLDNSARLGSRSDKPKFWTSARQSVGQSKKICPNADPGNRPTVRPTTFDPQTLGGVVGVRGCRMWLGSWLAGV